MPARNNTPPPAPHAANLVAKTVTKGQGDSMLKGRKAAEKVQANADKVAALNAAQAPAGAEWTSSKAATVGSWVAEAIKGRAANGPAEFRQVAEHAFKGTTRRLVFADGTTWSGGAATKLFVAPAKPKPNPEAVGTAVQQGAAPFGPVLGQIEAAAQAAAANRAERLALAKTEHATLQAWIKDGEKPPRPATPNLDAMNAEHAAGGPKAKGTTRAPRTTAQLPALYAEAKAVQKAANDKRGPGERVSAEQLAAVAAELRQQGLTQAQALEVAYWLRKLAVSRGTWAKAWEATSAAA